MTSRDVDRLIAKESFEYGNHTIEVEVRLKYTNQYNGQHDIMNSVEGYHYYRFVRVGAYHSSKKWPEVVTVDGSTVSLFSLSPETETALSRR